MGVPCAQSCARRASHIQELGLADPTLSDDALLDAIEAHPILMNRPLVVTPKGVRLCRPSEPVLDLLPPQAGEFFKENGERVIDDARPAGRNRIRKSQCPLFERYLTLWVALCIVAGIVLGHLMPGLFHAIGAAEIAKVDLPVAALIWLMIVPMLVKIDFAALGQVRQHWRGIGVTLFINWAVKPFSMAALGFVLHRLSFPALSARRSDRLLYRGLDPPRRRPLHGDGVRLVEPHPGRTAFHADQVALNDVIMVFAFAPIVGLLLGLSAITVPWDTLVLSVALYIVIPVIGAQLLRRWLVKTGGPAALSRMLATLQPVSLAALLATLVLLFGFQGEQIIAQPLVIRFWPCRS